MSSSVSVDDSFYFIQSLIPKNHTQAIDFIKEHPNYDGRNVRIAIWDTGVDPASEGLQITTEGKPKLVYMSDTSGSGDVHMGTEVKPDCQNKIKLLSNREITVPEFWNVGDQSLKIGLKSASDIFPAAVITRLSKDYKENIWIKEINRLQAELLNKKTRPQYHSTIFDLEAQFLKECLEIIEKSYEYPIPIFDIIVFQKEDWIACVDTTCLNPNMKLEDVPLLYSFQKQRQFTNFGGKTNLNFGVNIHNNGKLLEIVSCSGSHGTHVASIAAGYFPLRPECNGIAPGAEIVSIKISDNRLVSMETGMALAFAAKLTVELKCDIVNLSFGESSMQPNCGRVCQIMQELVSKHGITFCSSSGNDGPALSTVGSPGGTTDLLFGISPLVFPDMVESNYSLPVDNISDLSPQVYTWASRGPTTDGSLGIHVAAPGSAITSVAGWQNRTIGLMNGSSMSSPNACGGISLLLSAAHQLNKPITPWILALSTRNTASIISNISRFSQGNGLLQIKSAFEFIEKYWSNLDNQTITKQGDSVCRESCLSLKENEIRSNENQSNNLKMSVKNESTPILTSVGNHLLTNFKTGQTPLHLFRIKCNLSNGNRGILLREPFETSQKRHFTINIVPDFNEDIMEISDQVNIQLYLHLVCTASWVTCPRFFSLYNQERSISIQVDPTMLKRDLLEFEHSDCSESGDYGIYFTEIEFHCLEYSQFGPLARLPITVFKSEPISSLEWHHTTKFTSKKKTVRHFIATPPGADSLMMTIKPLSVVDGSGRFELRIMQVQPNFSTVNSELSKSFSFEKKSNMSINESVAYMLNGHTSSNVEIALAQYWSATNEAELEYSIDFHGLKISTEIVKMLSSDNHYRLLIESQLQMEEISPAISLNYLVVSLRPFKDELTYLQKSVSCDKELINLELFYTFNNSKPGNVGIFCPALGNLLYENDFYCQLYHIFDSNGRIIGSGDYKPETAFRRKNKYFFWLEKGDFKVQLNVRHGSIAQLERLRDQVIHVYFKTFQSLTFEFSKSIVDVNNNKKLTAARLNYCISKGEKSVLYITTPMTKVLKAFAVGSYLSGTLYLYKNETLRKTVSYPFQYIFTAHQSATEKGENSQHFKLPVHFTDCLMNYLRNEDIGRNSPVQYLPLEDIGVSSTMNEEKLLQEHIESLIEKPEFRDGLLNYLISWVKEFYKKSERNNIEKLITLINGDKCNADFELVQLKLLQNNGLSDLRSEERWSKVDDIVNKLITLWDTKDLSEYLGAKFSEASLSLTKDQKSKLDQNKQHLIEVLCIYGLCLCENILDTEKDYSEDDKDNCSEIRDKLNIVYSQVCRFVSPWDNNVTCLPFFVMHSYVFKCYGRMLKILLKCYEDQCTLQTALLIKEVLLKLEWNVLAQYYEKLIPLKHPISCQQQFRK